MPKLTLYVTIQLSQCFDVIMQYDEEFEDLMRVGMPDPYKACTEEVPLCKNIKKADVPRPTIDKAPPKSYKGDSHEDL